MKTIVVIGGSSGIGKQVVHLMSEQGAEVYATYNTHPQEDEGHTHYFKYNALDDSLDVSALPEIIDGLVYTPGSINLKPFHRLSPDSFITDYQLQVIGAVKVIQALLPRLKKSEFGSIVLFSTIAVQKGFSYHAQVASSKGAIEGLTRSLAAEFAPNIRVNAIAPSLTETPLSQRMLKTDQQKENNANNHPLKRIGQPEDIAQMAAFLLSDKSSWITGQILHVDGGLSSLNT